jgi:flagella basal body P-ring formation protein FlgA
MSPAAFSPAAISPRTMPRPAMPVSPSAMSPSTMPPPIATAGTATTAAASEQQDAEALQRAASAFLRQQTNGLPGKVGITVLQPYPRGLAECVTLEPFMPPGARLWGNTTVGVRCVGARPWTLYLQARVSLQGTYYIAGRMINRGDTLTAADLVAREGDLTAMPQAIVTDPALAIGAVATGLISAGLPLRQDLLRSANAIQAGQSVTVVAAGNGFSISAQGSALSNASAGQQLRVKTENGQIVSGIVKKNGTVEVRL